MATQRNPKPVFDRMPPQNVDAERSVLGAMLLNEDAVGVSIEILRDEPADIFYTEAHQQIYSAVLALSRSTTPIDPVTLMEQLTRDGCLEQAGGVSYIADLSGAVPTSANVEYYARIVLDTAILRRLIVACTQLTGEAYSGASDVNGLLDRAEAAIFNIAEKRQLNPIYKIDSLLPESIERIDEIIKSRTGITGLATGFAKLDELTSGLQKSDMIVLAARPSVGKTAFALHMAANMSVRDSKSVLLFSLEMSKEQLVQRLLCMEGKIDSRRLRTGFLAKSEYHKVTRAADKLSRANLFIDDSPSISILELRSKARRHMAHHGLDLIVVDYLQLMSTPGRSESRQVEISEISRSIKGIARELRIPVMALSQLSREAEKDESGTPRLSHLRESGAIEQDADVVMMLSRPPVHDREGNEDLITLTLAKQRNGPTGTMQMLFDRNIQQFKNVTDGHTAGAAEPSYGPPEETEEQFASEDDDVPF